MLYQHKQIIKFFKANREQTFNQHELTKQLNLGVDSRTIRKYISEINCDRSNKFIILTNSKGYYVPKRITPKLVKEEAIKLSKRARKEFYRSYSMAKKFNLNEKDIFGNLTGGFESVETQQ